MRLYFKTPFKVSYMAAFLNVLEVVNEKAAEMWIQTRCMQKHNDSMCVGEKKRENSNKGKHK